MNKNAVALVLIDAAVEARSEYDRLGREKAVLNAGRLYDEADLVWRKSHTLLCKWEGAWNLLRDLGHLEA